MPRPMPSVCLLSAILLSAGCHLGPQVRSYSPLDQVTRIEVKAELSDYLTHTIDDPAEISRIVAFVNERRGGWGGSSDWAGVPVPQCVRVLLQGAGVQGALRGRAGVLRVPARRGLLVQAVRGGGGEAIPGTGGNALSRAPQVVDARRTRRFTFADHQIGMSLLHAAIACEFTFTAAEFDSYGVS